MKKLRMDRTTSITLEEGCQLYLNDCRQRNLREATINHYRQSYLQMFKAFDPQTPLNEINIQTYNEYVIFLKKRLTNDISINGYLRDFITTLHFLMESGHVQPFKMKSIKVDQSHVETYTDEELHLLLKKPDLKKCSFIEYQCWVMTNFLFSTGIRQRSLMNIKVQDVDLENMIVAIRVTKNRKTLLLPLNTTMVAVLKEYLRHRQHKSEEDYLFCNVFGKQLLKATCYHMLYHYNKNRGVDRTGIHRYRHTFAKQWILNGGNVVALSKMLGHSNLSITQNYINLLVTDLSKQVEEINLLDRFAPNKRIKL